MTVPIRTRPDGTKYPIGGGGGSKGSGGETSCGSVVYAHPGNDVANFHRIVVDGSTFPLEWLKLTVNPEAFYPSTRRRPTRSARSPGSACPDVLTENPYPRPRSAILRAELIGVSPAISLVIRSASPRIAAN